MYKLQAIYRLVKILPGGRNDKSIYTAVTKEFDPIDFASFRLDKHYSWRKFASRIDQFKNSEMVRFLYCSFAIMALLQAKGILG